MTLDACQQDLPCVPQGKQSPWILDDSSFAAGMRAQLEPSIHPHTSHGVAWLLSCSFWM